MIKTKCLGSSLPVQVVGVSMIIRHQGYNTRTKDSDVALLKLQQPLVFNQFIRPIDIWMNPLSPFRKCTITGWGSTQESEQDSVLQTSDKELQSDLFLSSAHQMVLVSTDCRR